VEPLRLITPPAAEPVALSDFKNILRIPLADTSWDSTLTIYLVAAREQVENYCRIALITQTWLARLDQFPSIPLRYDRNGYPQILLPKPPFQSVQSFTYVDTSGAVQTLTRDASYGTNLAAPFYGYQLTPGGGIFPAALTPPWARPWAPQRMVPANTTIQFRCGYGGPVTVSTTANSAALTAPGFTFDADDAPAITGDTGLPISIPGAGVSGATLVTNVASVSNGAATLAVNASTAVVNATAWIGQTVPMSLCLAIHFLAQYYFEQGAVTDTMPPRVVDSLRNGGFRNLVS
jgi:gp6-like head-tail connector protein